MRFNVAHISRQIPKLTLSEGSVSFGKQEEEQDY
jgi:hypothetical protein